MLVAVGTGESTHVSLLTRLRDRPTTTGWGEFDDRYRELLYRYARRRGATHEEAEDIVQEVVLYVFKAMNRFLYDPSKGRFRSYLRTSVIHVMARRASQAARGGTALDPEVLAAEADSSADSDPTWEREWQLHRVRCAMLDVACEFEASTLEAFRLHVLGGMPVEKAAEQLGISKASVYQAKCRVLKRLKEKVELLASSDA